MARASSNNSKSANFKEFSFDTKEFKFTGRIYPESTKHTDKVDITSLSLCINGLITIKGCKLMQGDKNAWISFPAYKVKDSGEYNSYIFIDKAFAEAEFSKLVEYLESLIK